MDLPIGGVAIGKGLQSTGLPCLVSFCCLLKTSLLLMLQVQTLPDTTQPKGKIPHSSKMAVTFEPVMQL